VRRCSFRMVPILASCLACADAAGPAASHELRVDPAWVVGEAAGAVDPATGLFTLVPAEPSVLTAEAADSVAVAYGRMMLSPSTFGNSRAVLEGDRMGPISAWDRMRACDRTVHRLTPFGAVPSALRPPFDRLFASRWGVILCGTGDTPEIAVDVSDLDLGLSYVGQDFTPASVRSLNGAIIAFGIRRTLGAARALSPEEAVKAVFELTGRPIRRPPRSVLRWLPLYTSQICPSWELELAAPVTGLNVDTGDSVTVSSLLVERGLPHCIGAPVEFRIAAPVQPTELWYPFPVSAGSSERDSVAVPIIRPVLYHRLLLTPQ
jgi:hypothetical protein